VLPPRSTSLSARDAFHRQVLPAPACAVRRARHLPRGLATAGPASGTSPSRGFRPESWTNKACEAHRPEARLVRRRLSTSATTAVLQHSRGQTVHPASHRELSPGGAGNPAPCWCRAGRAFSNQGPPRAIRPRQHLLRRLLVEELHPSPMGPDTSCREDAPAQVGETERRKGTDSRVSAAEDARDAFRSRARDCFPPRSETQAAHPRCLPSTSSPEGPTWLSTGCSHPVEYLM
jgi:hypothetical protein